MSFSRLDWVVHNPFKVQLHVNNSKKYCPIVKAFHREASVLPLARMYKTLGQRGCKPRRLSHAIHRPMNAHLNISSKFRANLFLSLWIRKWKMETGCPLWATVMRPPMQTRTGMRPLMLNSLPGTIKNTNFRSHVNVYLLLFYFTQIHIDTHTLTV